MHGGAIGFTSQKGVGSTFSFYIQSRMSTPTPFSKELVENHLTAVDRSIQSHATALRSKTYTEAAVTLSSNTGITKNTMSDSDLYILIVEDNLVNQRVLAKQLRNLGMHVAVANHGGEALNYLKSTRYQQGNENGTELTLILMDWEVSLFHENECSFKA